MKADDVICGIYIIINMINEKCYVGQAKDIFERWKVHKRRSTWSSHPNKALYAAFMKYGIENFSFQILEHCSVEDLDRLEIRYISIKDSYKNGYNRTLGGQGYVVDEEEYLKNKLKRMYSMDLEKIIEKMTPLYVTKKESLDEFMPIYSKKQLRNIKKDRKKYNETFDVFVDYEPYNSDDYTHLYIVLSSVNRYLIGNVRDLESNFYIEKFFTEDEFNVLIDKLQWNIDSNELVLNSCINYEDIDDYVVHNNSTKPRDSIYDLIPDYDELGGDDYFEGCYF